MQNIDAIRGYERTILFNPDNMYTTSGGIAVTNCVVETKENDATFEGFRNWQAIEPPVFNGPGPALSLRFYHEPSSLAYDDRTPIGIEITLGLEMAQSLIEHTIVQNSFSGCGRLRAE